MCSFFFPLFLIATPPLALPCTPFSRIHLYICSHTLLAYLYFILKKERTHTLKIAPPSPSLTISTITHLACTLTHHKTHARDLYSRIHSHIHTLTINFYRNHVHKFLLVKKSVPNLYLIFWPAVDPLQPRYGKIVNALYNPPSQSK